jgi:AcrR family transcriptional regulator
MTSATPDPAPSRRERRRRELHERILDSAVALFESKGFASTTALEIANTADVAEKTFYNHFPTKQHLIEELAERALQNSVEQLNEARRVAGTTADCLRQFSERTADAAEHGSRQLTREVLLELVRVTQVDGVGPDRSRALHRGFRALLEDGVARGDVAPGCEFDFVTDLAVAAYLGIIINWVTLPDYPLRERLRVAAEAGARMLGNGLTPRTEKERR